MVRFHTLTFALMAISFYSPTKPGDMRWAFVLLLWVIQMLILMTNSIYSGLVGAFVGGIVTLIGYIMTTIVQSRNGKEAIEMQKEVANMQRKQKLFYESQIHWTNEARKIIAEFIDNCFQFNILTADIQKVANEVKSKSKLTLNEKSDLLGKNATNGLKAKELLSTLNKEVTMIRLYLFHKDDEYEQRVLQTILQIEHNMDVETGVDGKLMNDFVDIVRDYFDHQMNEMKKESN